MEVNREITEKKRKGKTGGDWDIGSSTKINSTEKLEK